jgi:alpha-glucosidase
MFVRAGAIIPLGPALNYVGERPVDPITFNIYPDEAGSASAKLYEDDGLTPEYKNGAFRRTSLTARRGPSGLVVAIGAAEGSYNPGPRKFNFVVPGQSLKTVTDNGKAQEIQIK